MEEQIETERIGKIELRYFKRKFGRTQVKLIIFSNPDHSEGFSETIISEDAGIAIANGHGIKIKD